MSVRERECQGASRRRKRQREGSVNENGVSRGRECQGEGSVKEKAQSRRRGR